MLQSGFPFGANCLLAAARGGGPAAGACTLRALKLKCCEPFSTLPAVGMAKLVDSVHLFKYSPSVQRHPTPTAHHNRLGTVETAVLSQPDREPAVSEPELKPVRGEMELWAGPSLSQCQLQRDTGQQPEPEPATTREEEPEAAVAAAAAAKMAPGLSPANKRLAATGTPAARSTPQSSRLRGCACEGGCSSGGTNDTSLREAMEQACMRAQADDLPGVQRALDRAKQLSPPGEFDINGQGSRNRTPLYLACHARAYNVTKWLLQQGATDPEGDAYRAICAVGRGSEAEHEDPGERTAAVMRRFFPRDRSPGASPRDNGSVLGHEPEPEPDPEPEPEPMDEWQGRWGRRLRGLCQPVPQGPSLGNLVRASTFKLGQTFTTDAKAIVEHLNSLDGARKLLLHKIGGSQTVDGKTVNLVAAMCEFEELELDVLTKQNSNLGGDVGSMMNEDAWKETTERLGNRPAYEVTEISIEGGCPIALGDYYLEVGREEEIIYLYHREALLPQSKDAIRTTFDEKDAKLVIDFLDELTSEHKKSLRGKKGPIAVKEKKFNLESTMYQFDGSREQGGNSNYSHSFSYLQTIWQSINPDLWKLDDHIYEVDEGFALLREDDQSPKKYHFRDGTTVKKYSKLYHTDPESASAIVYQAKLGYSKWYRRKNADGNNTNFMTFMSEVIELTGVDGLLDHGTNACTRECCHRIFMKTPSVCCKGCWSTVSKFFWNDVEADHSTDSCQWLWIFMLQLTTHLVFPPLVFCSRTRKADQIPPNLVVERFMVLSIRWVVLVGTFSCYSMGWLPSIAKSEPIMNLVMWLFVAVTHSAYEASLDEIPHRYNDTLTGSLTLSSKHVNTHVAVDEKSMLEKELTQFVQLGKRSQKHNKFSHRMTERRLHELYEGELQIEDAVFETFHSEELERAVPPGRNRDLVFDEAITFLQGKLPDDWCARSEKSNEVIPSSVRRAAARVRMYIKAIARRRYGTSVTGNSFPGQETSDESLERSASRSYAKEVDSYAWEALQWELYGRIPDENKIASQQTCSNHRCVCRRKGINQSRTDSMLRQWDSLAARVQSVLSTRDDTMGCWKHCRNNGLNCRSVSRTLLSLSLVVFLVWIGQKVSRNIYIWAGTECTTIGCVLYSLFTVAGLALLIYLVCTSLQKLWGLLVALHKDSLPQIQYEIKEFIAHWNEWLQERQQSWKEQEDKPSLSDQLTLAKLTSLSADRLQLHRDRPGSSALFLHSFDDYDTFALNMSRLYKNSSQAGQSLDEQWQHRRQDVLSSWKERRQHELLTAQTRAQKVFDGKYRGLPGDEELKYTVSTRRRDDLYTDWEDLVKLKVEREAAILNLRAQLICELDRQADYSRVERSPGQTESHSDDLGDLEATTPPRRVDVPTAHRVERQCVQNARTPGLFRVPVLPPFIVAEAILALAHTHSKKVYKAHLVLVLTFCVLYALVHPLKDLAAQLLGVPCSDDVVYTCTDGVNSTFSNVLDIAVRCADIVYNSTVHKPCGEFCVAEKTIFFACTPKVYEVIARIISSVVGATLMFCIFADLADVIRGYAMRLEAIQFFSQLTPHQGMHTHERNSHCKSSSLSRSCTSQDLCQPFDRQFAVSYVLCRMCVVRALTHVWLWTVRRAVANI